MNNTRTYGIEIECKQATNAGEQGRNTIAALIASKGVACNAEGYHHRTTNHWRVTTDASVGSYSNGIEVVSPILTGEAGLAELALVLEALNELGCIVDRQCGIHVHWGIADLTLNSVKNACSLYSKYEAQIDSIQPRSRRGNNNQYCRSINTNGMNETLKNIARATDMHGVKDAVNQGTRYRKLNLESFWRYSTMEFRQHSGSLDFEKIVAWVKLTNGIVEAGVKANRIKSTGSDKFEGLMKLIEDKAVRRFYRKRNNELSA